jgi:hypothetical protein
MNYFIGFEEYLKDYRLMCEFIYIYWMCLSRVSDPEFWQLLKYFYLLNIILFWNDFFCFKFKFKVCWLKSTSHHRDTQEKVA